MTISKAVSILPRVSEKIMLKPEQWICWVIVMGALWECLCFALRALGARDQQNANYVVASTLLVLLAPLCKSHEFHSIPFFHPCKQSLTSDSYRDKRIRIHDGSETCSTSSPPKPLARRISSMACEAVRRS